MRQVLRSVGRYEILRELGRGGMAVVYLARDTTLDRLVALKELGAFRVGDPQFVRRFMQEARLAGSLTHPNIVTVHDFFEHDDVPYISMEFAERGSLRSYIGELSLAQIGGVLEAVLAGLAHAAQRGVLHRDIKPENIVVTGDRIVKITDFGIGKAVDRLSTATTPAGPVGTPAYLAPEQAHGGELGPATDLYAVGVMAHEMLVGQLPAPARWRLSDDPGASPLAVDPALDDGLASWVERMLAMDPSRRHADAGQAWADLEGHMNRLLGPRWRSDARLPDSAPGPGLADLSTNQAADRTSSADAVALLRAGDFSSLTPSGADETPALWRRSRWTVAAGVALVAAAVGLTLVLISRPSSNDGGSGLVLKPGPEGCITSDYTGAACASARATDGLHAIAASADGKNVYVAAKRASALVAFDRDPDSGSLTPQTGAAGCFTTVAKHGCTHSVLVTGAESVAVSRDGRSVYAASVGSSALAILDRDVDSGRLTPHPGRTGCFARDAGTCALVRAMNHADGVAVSPDNRNVYVASYRSDAVATFDRDRRGGALEQKAGRAGCVARDIGSCSEAKLLKGPEAVTVSPDGRNVYVASYDERAVIVFDRDRSGALHLKGGQSACVSADGTNNECAIAPGVGVGDSPNSVAVSPDRRNVYVAGEQGVVAVLDRDGHGTLKAKRGAAGCMSKTGDGGRCRRAETLGDQRSSVTVSPDGSSVYVVSSEPGGVTVFDRDDRGALRPRPGREGCVSENGFGGRCAKARRLAGASGVVASPDGRNVYVTSYDKGVVTLLDRVGATP